MEKKIRKFLDAFKLEDNNLHEFYSNVAREKYELTIELFMYASKILLAYVKCDSENSFYDLLNFERANKNLGTVEFKAKCDTFAKAEFKTILKEFLNKDYHIPDDPFQKLDHLFILSHVYLSFIEDPKPHRRRFNNPSAFFYIDRISLPLVKEVSMLSQRYYRWGEEKELSHLQQKGRSKKTAKIKQDCIEAYYDILPEDRSTLSNNWIAEKTIPKNLVKVYGYTSREKAKEMKKNGLKKPKWIVPSINKILEHIKNELPPKRTNQ